MQILSIAWRFLVCVVSATAYQIATNPYVLAFLLVLTGRSEASAYLLVAWLLLCAVAVALSKDRHSPIAGREVFTTPGFLFLLGNAQEGNAPDWYRARHPKWPRWLCAFVFMSWRNKLRNLPFVRALAWLHRPNPKLPPMFDSWKLGGALVELHWIGWLTELKASKGKWFLDIGPRLDHAGPFGACAWAFRPFGRIA